MTILPHLLLFGLSAAVIWGLSGILVAATDRVAKRYHRPGFGVAFFVLGILTSVSEISVAANATMKGVPQISAGNLIGGSLVIFLLIIPLLATMGGGIQMKKVLTQRSVAFVLAVVILPALFIVDGRVSKPEGILMIVTYLALFYVLEKKKPTEAMVTQAAGDVSAELVSRRRATMLDVAKVTVAGALIFVAGKILVDESLFFAHALSIPPSLVGLILLSIGTNAPEIVIAIRCVVGKRKDIAFGDYMGSAAANTLVMGFLPLLNGSFSVERSEFVSTFALLMVGLALFFWFSRSKQDISRREGGMLLAVYGLFMLFQLVNVLHFANDSIALK